MVAGGKYKLFTFSRGFHPTCSSILSCRSSAASTASKNSSSLIRLLGPSYENHIVLITGFLTVSTFSEYFTFLHAWKWSRPKGLHSMQMSGSFFNSTLRTNDTTDVVIPLIETSHTSVCISSTGCWTEKGKGADTGRLEVGVTEEWCAFEAFGSHRKDERTVGEAY